MMARETALRRALEDPERAERRVDGVDARGASAFDGEQILLGDLLQVPVAAAQEQPGRKPGSVLPGVRV